MNSCATQIRVPPTRELVKMYPGLNGAKGLLIVMVVFAHCLPPSTMLYFMYFFHMPLFMAISGFLLKQAAFKNGYMAYMKRLWHRLILPWIAATLIFMPLRFSQDHNVRLQFADIIYPYYHLWYIPSYLIGATICYAIIKQKIPAWIVLLATAIITIVWYNVYRDTPLSVTELPLYWLGDKRMVAYLFFFILAFCIRNKLAQINISSIQLIIIKALTIAALVFLVLKRSSSIYIVWPFMLFNTCLVLYILMYIAPKNYLQNKWFLLINKQSLGLYLYHPLIIAGVYRVLYNKGQHHVSNLQASGIFVVVLLLTMGLVWLLKGWEVTNRYVLGNIKCSEKIV